MEVRDDVLKSLETARNEKLIGAPLEARVRLSANGDLYPLLEQYAGELPGLFIVSQVDRRTRRSGRTIGVKVERAAGDEVRALLEVHDRTSAPIRSFPTICAACADAVDEMLNG